MKQIHSLRDFSWVADWLGLTCHRKACDQLGRKYRNRTSMKSACPALALSLSDCAGCTGNRWSNHHSRIPPSLLGASRRPVGCNRYEPMLIQKLKHYGLQSVAYKPSL